MAAVTIGLPETSRYKDTAVYRTPDDKIVPALLVLPSEFAEGQDGQRLHRLADTEIGNFDRIAVAYYGPGMESAWPAIALANGIIDVEYEPRAGDTLVIPPRDQVLKFVARDSNGDTQ